MNELIKEAAKIKTAQLKSRAARQPWETAPLWFKGTSHLPPKLTALRESSIGDRLNASVQLKEDGNEALTVLHDPQAAIDKYVASIGLFLWFERRGKGGEVLEDVPLVCSLKDGNAVKAMGKASSIDEEEEEEEEEDLKEQAKAHVASCFSNIALCLLKLARESDEDSVEGQYTSEAAEGALFACNKALEFDPYNVRALFRRSEARSLLPGSGYDELEASVFDLETALKLEPGNAQVRSSLAAKKEELRELKKKSRAALSGLFDNKEGSMGLYQDEEKKQAGKASSQALSHLREAKGTGLGRGTSGAFERKVGRTMGNRGSGFIETLSYVPWWGWLLIISHMAYRIFHIWRAHARSVEANDLDLGTQRSRLTITPGHQEL